MGYSERRWGVIERFYAYRFISTLHEYESSKYFKSTSKISAWNNILCAYYGNVNAKICMYGMITIKVPFLHLCKIENYWPESLEN